MSTPRAASAIVICASIFAAIAPVSAQSPQAIEFQVNVYTLNDQNDPDVAIDGDGAFVVVWDSYLQDSSQRGVFGRRFGIGGFPLSSDFQVSTHTLSTQINAAIAGHPNGDFVVAWQSYDQDQDQYGIFARRFDSAGSALAIEFQVNTHTLNDQERPAVAIDADGDFIVAWMGEGNQDGDGSGIFAQRYLGGGGPFFGEFQVNELTVGPQSLPSVAVAGDGSFVIAWTSQPSVAGGLEVMARRFSPFSASIGAEFQVNVRTANSQLYPSVAIAGNGDFVIVWVSFLQDGAQNGIFGRRFSSSGTAQGDEFLVNLRTVDNQLNPEVSAESGGRFLVVWSSTLQDGSGPGVFMRRFAANGTALTGDLQVNTYTSSTQESPAVASRAGGDFVVVWTSSQDGGGFSGIFGQRFAGSLSIDVDADGAVLPLTDGLLILRFLFGFTGNTLITGAVNLAGCGRCTAPEIEAFLNALF